LASERASENVAISASVALARSCPAARHAVVGAQFAGLRGRQNAADGADVTLSVSGRVARRAVLSARAVSVDSGSVRSLTRVALAGQVSTGVTVLTNTRNAEAVCSFDGISGLASHAVGEGGTSAARRRAR